MKIIRAGLFAILMTAGASPAWSQATRTWISGVGDDVNPCSRTAPCKTFAGAISKTAAGGEINAIDPGGFGTITITKSITLDGYGPMTSILAAGATNGVVVNGAGIVVNLRNLTINCAGSTTPSGIRIVNAATVNIENVVIENCNGINAAGRGIAIETAADVRVNVRNVTFANLTNFGIHSNPSAGTVFLSVDDSVFMRGSTTAIQLRQNTSALINETTVSGHNPGAAVAAELGTVTAMISNSAFHGNAFGIFSGNGGAPVIRIRNTTITGSTTAGIQISSGQVLSSGNNTVRGNAGAEGVSAVEPQT
jgi:hypothetical protein